MSAASVSSEEEWEEPLRGQDARNPHMFVHVPANKARSFPLLYETVSLAYLDALKWSGPSIQHKWFSGDYAFGPLDNNEQVYQSLICDQKVRASFFAGED